MPGQTGATVASLQPPQDSDEAGGSRPASGPRRLARIGAAILVVAVFLVAGLWAAGWIPGTSSSSTTAVSYSAAAEVANSASESYSGGGWMLIGAIGLTMHDGSTLQLPSFGPVCPMHVAAGMNGVSAMFPGYDDPGSGVSPAWEMMYRNSSGAFLLVTVMNGRAQVIGDASGSNCLLYPFARGVPSSVLDSTNAVAAINQAGGSAFLAAHSSVSSVISVTGGFSGRAFPSPPPNATWGVIYSSCSGGSGMMATGSAFIGWANATSGIVLNTTQVSGACNAAWSMPSMPAMPPTVWWLRSVVPT